MTRHNCDRCGVEIKPPDWVKEEIVGTMRYDPNMYSLTPKIDSFELCQPCKAFIIDAATVYKRGSK